MVALQTIEGEEQLVIFEVADEQYGVEISAVCEIISMRNITGVPKTPDFVEGVINLRSQVIPVVDLRRRLGMPRGERSRASRIMVVKIGQQTNGMIVDSVSEVLRIPSTVVEPPSSLVAGADSQFLRGIAKLQDRLIILLSMEEIFARTEAETPAAA